MDAEPAAAGGTDLGDRKTAAVLLAAAVAVFAALRIALIYSREADLDEIFTSWIITRGYRGILETLALDSGPPLHYFLLRTLQGWTTVAARWVSFAFAAGTIGVLAFSRRRLEDRITVAALLAVYPQHVFFSAEGRAYAMCAFGYAVAVVALERLRVTVVKQVTLLAIAGAALLFAAYTHYYGVLMFPLLIVFAALFRRDLMKEAVVATAAVAALYAPGFFLAAQQQGQSVEWMRIPDTASRIALVTGSFGRLGFDARHQFTSAIGTALAGVIGMAVILIALWRTRLSREAQFMLVAVVVPIISVIAVAAAGITAYFPIRFESVLSASVVLWIVTSMTGSERHARAAVYVLAFATGLLVSIDIVRAPRPADTPERAIARAVRANLDPGVPIVASHLAYLEIFGRRDASWNPQLIGFPARCELHPGSRPSEAEVSRDLPRLANVRRPFLWVGPAASAEGRVMARSFAGRVVARAGGEVAVWIGR